MFTGPKKKRSPTNKIVHFTLPRFHNAPTPRVKKDEEIVGKKREFCDSRSNKKKKKTKYRYVWRREHFRISDPFPVQPCTYGSVLYTALGQAVISFIHPIFWLLVHIEKGILVMVYKWTYDNGCWGGRTLFPLYLVNLCHFRDSLPHAVRFKFFYSFYFIFLVGFLNGGSDRGV